MKLTSEVDEEYKLALNKTRLWSLSLEKMEKLFKFYTRVVFLVQEYKQFKLQFCNSSYNF